MGKKVIVVVGIILFICCILGNKEITKMIDNDTVNNQKMNEVKEITMEIKEGTLTKTKATIIITDLTENDNGYGLAFRIDKKENGKWEELEQKGEAWFTLAAHLLNENHQVEMEQDWSYIYGELKKGEYRLVKKNNDKYISVEFEIDE